MAATDYYVAATDVGAGNGTSCANADAITGSFFTSAGNWVSDMTWHLCGKFVGAARACEPGGGVFSWKQLHFCALGVGAQIQNCK